MYNVYNQQYSTFVGYPTFIQNWRKPMDRRNRKSKTALKSAMFSLMQKKLVSKISIRELCDLADVNRSTFYTNYGDINELVKDIHHDLFMDMFYKNRKIEKILYEFNLKEDIIYEMIHYVENNKDKINILFKNNENNLLERNLLFFFMEACEIDSVQYQKAYPFIYHTMAFFTILQTWVYNNYPCSAKELAQIIIHESLPLQEHFKGYAKA